MTQTQNSSDWPLISEFLQKLFQQHGVDAVVEDDWIVFPQYGRRANGDFCNLRDGQIKSVQLDVRVEAMCGRLLIESCAGLGASPDEAKRDALAAFTRNAFHVILAAFFRPHEEDDQVERETWIIGGKSRNITLGSCITHGKPPKPYPQEWLPYLQRKLVEQPLADGTHWLRIYYAQSDDKTMACEALLDNEEWLPVQQAMASFDWPKSENFYSLRLFLAIQGGPDISDALLALQAGSDRDEFVQNLIQQGWSEAQAEKAFALIPLAYGRCLLQEMPVAFTSEALVADWHTRRPREILLLDEPWYAQAWEMAAEH